MAEIEYEIAEIPVSRDLAWILAALDNDRDVAGGLPVDGATLDAFERARREAEAEAARRLFFG